MHLADFLRIELEQQNSDVHSATSRFLEGGIFLHFRLVALPKIKFQICPTCDWGKKMVHTYSQIER